MNQVILLKAEWGHLRVGIVGPIRLFGRPTMARILECVSDIMILSRHEVKTHQAGGKKTRHVHLLPS